MDWSWNQYLSRSARQENENGTELKSFLPSLRKKALLGFAVEVSRIVADLFRYTYS